MYEKEREAAVNVVAEACELGRTVQDQVVAAGDALAKKDRSPVTMADLAIQVVVSTRLGQAFPADPLLAEEDSAALSSSSEMSDRVHDLVRQSLPDATLEDMSAALDRGDYGGGGGRYWVLDPVDGTKGFLRGDQYAVALALVDRGEVVVGVLGCPNLELAPGDDRKGCLFVAVRGEGTTVRPVGDTTEQPVNVDPSTDPSGGVFCESVEAAHAAHSVHADIAGLLGVTSEPYRIDSQCKYGAVARGDASIYLRLPRDKTYREKVWDHAAGALVVEEAGGRVSDLDGKPLDFSAGRHLTTRRGIIVTNGAIHDAVLEAAKAAVAEEE